MIYRVGDQEHPGYDYSRQKPTQITGDSEKFSLDHRKDEDFSSKKKEKGEDKKLHEKKDAASLKEKSGIIGFRHQTFCQGREEKGVCVCGSFFRKRSLAFRQGDFWEAYTIRKRTVL